MSSNNTRPASAEQDDVTQQSDELENWLRSNESEIENDPSEEVTIESPPNPVPRGRGRPRVARRRDESAIEKRRAQVREAQRSYQKRKDKATAGDKRRVDELLQVLSDLSSDVETLLETASKAGLMSRNDKLSTHIQRLWASYNKTINADCVKPELRLLQIKNEERIATYHSSDNLGGAAAAEPKVGETGTAPDAALSESSEPFDPTQATFSFTKFGQTSVLQPYQRLTPFNTLLNGQTMFEIVRERQAALKESDKASKSK